MSLEQAEKLSLELRLKQEQFFEELIKKWSESGGCSECNGTGKILTFFTLDGPSWNEYRECDKCTIEQRKSLGSKPGTPYWEYAWPHQEDLNVLNILNEEINHAAEQQRKWSTLMKGVEVLVTRKSRAKNSPPKDCVCIVLGWKDNGFGTQTYYLKDKEGNFYRSPKNALQITSIKPEWKPPETFIPIIVVPRKTLRAGWSSLYMLSSFGEVRVFPEQLWVNGVKVVNKKYDTLINEKDEMINLIPDQSFSAEMPTWVYQKIFNTQTP